MVNFYVFLGWKMFKKKTLYSFYKRKERDNEELQPLSNTFAYNLDTNVQSIVEERIT